MNRWHLLALVGCVALINIGFSVKDGLPIDVDDFENSSKVAAILGALILFFELWGWRFPLLYPWFVNTPSIRGEWDIDSSIIWVSAAGNTGAKGAGILNVRQTFSTVWASIEWDDGSKMRFLMRAPIAVGKDGFCAFTAVYAYDDIASVGSRVIRHAGFFFHAVDRRPSTVEINYSTTDKQVGLVKLLKQRRMSFLRYVAPY